MKYNHKAVEPKWQEIWEEKGVFHAQDNSDKEKFYGKIVEDFVDGEDRIAKYEEDERRLSDMMMADPRAAQILVDMSNGADVAT